MSCTVTVEGATVNPATGKMTVGGTINFVGPSCGGSPTVQGKVYCGSRSFEINVLGSQTAWEATLPVDCNCDLPLSVQVVVRCPGPPPFSCSSTFFTIQNLCCCPQINTHVTPGSCTGTNQLVTFSTSVVNNTACPFSVRRNFGDGFFGSVFPIAPYTTQYLPDEPHNYAAPSSYTSFIDILSPPPLSACAGLEPIDVDVSCGNCHSKPFVASLCRFLEALFLFSMTASLSIGLAQPCVSLTVAAMFIAVAFLSIFFYVILQCQKCTCDFILNYWGVILIATGFVNVMYIPPGCAAITGFAAFINSIMLLTLGFIVLWLWYRNNRLTCPLLICDFWCSVSGIFSQRSATNIAIFVMFLVVGLTSGALASGFGVALVVVASFAVFIWTYGPLSHLPCKHTPTCQ